MRNDHGSGPAVHGRSWTYTPSLESELPQLSSPEEKLPLESSPGFYIGICQDISKYHQMRRMTEIPYPEMITRRI